MSRLRPEHQNLTDGEGKCSRPMWDGYGMPAGFCDRPAYGRQILPTKQAHLANRWYVPALACPAHGGPPHSPPGLASAPPDDRPTP